VDNCKQRGNESALRLQVWKEVEYRANSSSDHVLVGGMFRVFLDTGLLRRHFDCNVEISSESNVKSVKVA